jgi:hypothetical protein
LLVEKSDRIRNLENMITVASLVEAAHKLLPAIAKLFGLG